MLRLALIIVAFTIAASAGATERQVVLVVRADSPIVQLDPIEIRKVFLALPVLREGRPLRPIRNVSDQQLNQVFLQHVVAMSQSAYDRRILGQFLRYGQPRPLELMKNESVFDALYADRYAVTYMWLHDVAGNRRIRTLRILWTD
jgi:hypothetical protein